MPCRSISTSHSPALTSLATWGQQALRPQTIGCTPYASTSYDQMMTPITEECFKTYPDRPPRLEQPVYGQPILYVNRALAQELYQQAHVSVLLI